MGTDKQVILITGCRSGFGLRAAVTAARGGHKVYAGLRDLDTAGPLREAAAGLDVTPVQLDVTDQGERDAAVARILNEAGQLDALVNNAGVALGGFVEQVEEDELRQLFEVNVFAAFSLIKACLPSMRARGRGTIINVSSMSGRLAVPGLGTYAASKFALEGLSEALRHELRSFGVRVALVEPGPYATDIFDRNRRVCRAAERGGGPYEALQQRIEAFMQRRFSKNLGDPQEVAALIVRIVEDPRPRLRYPLGPGASPRLWMRKLLPFHLEEQVLDRLIGLPRRGA